MLDIEGVFILLMVLSIKHFVADTLLQTSYQYLNKGCFLHPGGILHAYIHAVCSILCFILLYDEVPYQFLIVIGLLESTLHYFIDFTKTRVNSDMGWSKIEHDTKHLIITHNLFFYAFVLDQVLHFLTYILLAYMFYIMNDIVTIFNMFVLIRG